MTKQREETLLSLLHSRGDAPVALSESGAAISAADLLRQAGVLAALLPDPTPDSEVAFSFGRDRLGFLAGLLATWARGHTAALPADGSRDTILPVFEREENVAFLHDTGVGLGIPVPKVLAATPAGEVPELERLEAGRPAIAAFRQPPIGAPTVARWTLPELLATLDELVEFLGLPAGAHVVSSLTPTAPPGLLLGLLAPLRCGATFASLTPAGSDELLHQVRSQRAHTLIVTPAHARRLAGRPGADLRPLDTIYCVDEGLDSRSTDRLRERQGVRVADGPALPLDEESPSFVVTLRDLLLAHEEVSDVAISLLPAADGAPGRAFVAVAGPQALADTLRARVEEHVPREFSHDLRLLPALPRDDNGRLPDWRARLLFGYGREGSKLETELAWTEIEESEPDARRFRTRVPQFYAFMEGHYTSYPVLAGVAQVHEFVLPCVRRVRPGAGGLKQLGGLKFMSRIAPGDEVDVVIRKGTAPHGFRFELLRGETRCSIGRLEFLASGETRDVPGAGR